jgi:hypothetical protein
MYSTLQTNRGLLLSYRKGFKKQLSDSVAQSDFHDIFSDYTSSIKEEFELEIPDALFNILYTSFIPVSKVLFDDYIMSSSEFDKQQVNPEENSKPSKEHLTDEEKEIIKKEKDAVDKFEKYSKMLTEAVKISWDIYVKDMPIEIFGLPEKYIVEWLIGNVFNVAQGNDIFIPEKPYPYIEKTFDAFGVLKDYEINYLHRLCDENSIDYTKKMEDDGQMNLMYNIAKALEVNPLCSVIVPPNVAAARFTDTDVRKNIRKGFISTLKDIQFRGKKFRSNSYEKQLKYVDTYADDYFSKGLSIKTIKAKLIKTADIANDPITKRTPKVIEILKTNKAIGYRKNTERNIKKMLENAGTKPRPESTIQEEKKENKP